MDRHPTAIYTLTIFATIHLLETLIEDYFSLFALITFLISLSQRYLQLKHGIVIMLQNLGSELIRLFYRIQRLIVLTLIRKNAGRFLIEIHEYALVRDFIFGELEPAFGLRRIFFELAIKCGKRHAKSTILLRGQNGCVLLVKLVSVEQLMDAILGPYLVLNVLLRCYLTQGQLCKRLQPHVLHPTAQLENLLPDRIHSFKHLLIL